MRKRVVAIAGLMFIALLFLIGYAVGSFKCDRCGRQSTDTPKVFVTEDQTMHVCNNCYQVLVEVSRLQQHTIVR